MKASTLLNLLAVRHSGDLFVSECKNGPTQGVAKGSMVRLDAWAMKRSWSNPHTYGYEIKVSRSDFLGDNKWHRYLELCSHFSFVSPVGVIKKNELPPEVGLIVPTKNGNKLLTKKKAPRRDVTLPEDLFRYVLMCRASIGRGEMDFESKREFWESWLEEREISREVGRRCSRALRKEIQSKVTDARIENDRLKSQLVHLENVKKLCDALNINPAFVTSRVLESKVANETETEVVPRRIHRALERVEALVDSVMMEIRHMEGNQ